MNTEEYWIGEGVDYDALWASYHGGLAYIDKLKTMRVHLLRIEFERYPDALPLFNHEVISKTLKGYFHDMKKACLSPAEYNVAGPLFLYSVERGSSKWDFLGELRQLLMLGTTLADEKVMGERLDNLDKRLSILRRHFGSVLTREALQAFMDAKTPRQLDRAVHHLIEEGICSVQVSRAPFAGDIEDTEQTLLELKGLDQPDPEDTLD
jgi:hypothetical protein